MKTLLMLLLSSACCFGQTNLITYTTKAGKLITDAKVVKVEPNALIVTYPGGGGRVLMADLPEDIQLQFGYTPAKAAAYEAELAEKKKAEAKVLQARAATVAMGQQRAKIEATKMVIEGKVMQKTSEGILIDSGADRLYAATESGYSFDQRGNMSKWGGGTAALYTEGIQVYIGLCLLTDHPSYSKLVDGDKIAIVAWPNGQYTYTAVSKSMKSIRRFTANLSNVNSPATPEEEKVMRAMKGR